MNQLNNYLTLLLAITTITRAYYRRGPIHGNSFGVPGRNATYDYVVVGGGTAGLAMAMRLAEDGTKTVAIIEAGGFYEQDMGNVSVVPNLGLVYDTGIPQLTDAFPTVDWGVVTTPQTGLMNQTYHYWRGRTLGGSSALNNEVYQRGTKQSYQMWAELVGDKTYEWDSFLPYFRKSAHYTPPDMSKRTANASVPEPSPEAFDNSGGPLEVGYVNYPLQFGSWTKLAFQELGFRTLSDMDSGVLLGAQYTTQTIAPDMTRSSSQASYLEAAFDGLYQNLVIYPRTLAKRIVFDSNKTAIAVEVTTMELPYAITASREIVVSAGAINSPQLLMVSGIGPSSTLQRFSIPVIADLPGVGSNLWDHILFPVTYQVNLQGAGRLNNPANVYVATEEYLTNRTGQLTNTGFDFVAWEKLPDVNRQAIGDRALRDLAQFPEDWPELEFIIGDAIVPGSDDSYASVIAALVAPLSRGHVTINSSDTGVLPIFDPAWLESPTDQRVAVECLKRARAVFATDAVQPVLIGDEVVPGKAVQTDDQILAYIRQSATTVYHAACTCKMGTTDDPMAVIDSRARVYGVNRLRVVDASSFPILPPGHPSSTIYALAEKIAEDMILSSSCSSHHYSTTREMKHKDDGDNDDDDDDDDDNLNNIQTIKLSSQVRERTNGSGDG